MTNGDAIRKMSNEEIAKLIANDRMIAFKTLNSKYGASFDLEALNHAFYCVLLEGLNREVDNDEQRNSGENP